MFAFHVKYFIAANAAPQSPLLLSSQMLRCVGRHEPTAASIDRTVLFYCKQTSRILEQSLYTWRDVEDKMNRPEAEVAVRKNLEARATCQITYRSCLSGLMIQFDAGDDSRSSDLLHVKAPIAKSTLTAPHTLST